MTEEELNKLRLEILSDKSIIGISYDSKEFLDEPKIPITRFVKKVYLPGEFETWDD